MAAVKQKVLPPSSGLQAVGPSKCCKWLGWECCSSILVGYIEYGQSEPQKEMGDTTLPHGSAWQHPLQPSYINKTHLHPDHVNVYLDVIP